MLFYTPCRIWMFPGHLAKNGWLQFRKISPLRLEVRGL